jgi:hypothetical protein
VLLDERPNRLMRWLGRIVGTTVLIWMSKLFITSQFQLSQSFTLMLLFLNLFIPVPAVRMNESQIKSKEYSFETF